jgi:hypothetical protein
MMMANGTQHPRRMGDATEVFEQTRPTVSRRRRPEATPFSSARSCSRELKMDPPSCAAKLDQA